MIPTESPNPFATRRNRDILTSSIAATLAGAITILAPMAFWCGALGGFGGRGVDWRDREGGLGGLVTLLLAPFAAGLIQLWVSRTREHEADASGAHLTGNPYALASALEKISTVSRRIPPAASPGSGHLFIAQPLLSGEMLTSLFSTHPPMQKGIKRLIGRPSVQGSIQ